MKSAILVFPGINRERDMARALKSLGVDGISSVRQGKVFDIELSGADKA